MREVELVQVNRWWLPSVKWVAAWLTVLGLLDLDTSAQWLAKHGVKRTIKYLQ
jgi:hypothetical protein